MEAIRSLRDAHNLRDREYWTLLNTMLPFLLVIIGVRLLRVNEVIPGWFSSALTYFLFPFLTTAIVGSCYSYFNESLDNPPSLVGSLVYLPQGAILLITTFLVSLIIALPILFAAGFLSFLGTPGIILLAIFIVAIASPLFFLDAEIVISEHGPISAIRGSFSFVRGNAFNVFIYFLVRFGVSSVGTVALAFPLETTSLISSTVPSGLPTPLYIGLYVLAYGTLFVVLPVLSQAVIYPYHTLFYARQKDGVKLEAADRESRFGSLRSGT